MTTASTAHNPLAEAEISVLGGILFEGDKPLPNAALTTAREHLANGEEFSSPRHRMIYAAMLKLDDSGEQINLSTLSTEIQKCGGDGGGELDYLEGIMERVYTAAMVSPCAKIVKDAAMKRQARAALFEAAERIKDGGEIDEVAADGLRVFEEIRAASKPAADRWPDPEPLPEAMLPVRPLDSSIIPEVLRGWIFDSAERMSTAPDYAFAATLVMLSAIVGRSVGIRPKREDSWMVSPNLWGAVIGSASVKKTPAIQDALRPLHRLERKTREDYQAEIQNHEADKDMAKLKIESIRNEIREATREKQPSKLGELKARLSAALGESERAAPDVRRRYTVDTTMEKLGELLAKSVNDRGMLIFRDELSGWFAGLEKPGHQTDRTFFLEGWNGNVPYTFDRLNRGTVTIDHLCISLFGGIQPSRILPLIQSTIRENGADGFFQRLQVLVYPDEPPFRWIDRKPDEAAENRVYSVAEALDTRPPEAFGAQPCTNGHFLRFSPDAYGLFKEWYTDLEAMKRGTEEHPAFVTHIGKYPKLMPALALLYHLIDVADGRAEPGNVTEEAAARAIQATAYFMEHAKRVYGLIVHPGAEAARLILKKIQAGRLQDGFRKRDIGRKGWAGLDSDTIPPACAMLADYGYLKASVIEPSTIGGRPSTVYLINPKAGRVSP